jgi:hypothetical protein
MQMAHTLAEGDDGVGFDAVMSMAIALSPIASISWLSMTGPWLH